MNVLFKFFRKIYAREEWHPVLTYPLYLFRIALLKYRYGKKVAEIRDFPLERKIRVAFLNMDISKWKCQSLYDLMKTDNRYEPIIVLTVTDEDENHTAEDIKRRNAEARCFYEKHGCQVVIGCDEETKQPIPLDRLGVDIVFYQVPWGFMAGQRVVDVSRYALCCYMPYGIESIEWKNKSSRFDFHHMANFHTLMWYNFNCSPAIAKYNASKQWPWEWAGRQVGTGHTCLDSFYLHPELVKRPGDCVIYAPHFSFTWKDRSPIMNLSTFPWTGKPILEYAKCHPDIHWAFKPHPKLREYLVETGFMTKDEVDEYYASWENIGENCYDGDYQDLFGKSFAMITDCSSFLCEYMAVGKPLIRLVPEDIRIKAEPPCEQLFNSFYACYTIEEMCASFKTVLEEKLDPKRDERLDACRDLCLVGNYAAKKIMSVLESELVNPKG